MAEDFVQQGKLLLQRREFSEVVRVCRLGLLSRPGLVDGRLLLGTALLALRRYEEVLAEMRVAGELDRDNLLVFMLRGEALLRKGEAEEAVEVLARAVEIDPQNRVARKLYGEARNKAGLEDLPPPSTELPPVEPDLPPLPIGSREEAAIADAPGPAAEPARDETPGQRRRRTWLVVAAAALVLLGVAGGGVVYYLRSSAQAHKLETLRADAEKAAAAQTFRGYVAAREIYLRMVQAGDETAVAPAARLRAATAYEFGVRLPDDGAALGAGRDAQLAAIYQTLAAGDAAAAVRQAATAEEAFADDAEVAYVAGRARLAARDAAGVDALRRSVDLLPTPLANVALAEAEAAAGRLPDALRALDAALALAPGHPAVAIARARVLAAAGQLPPASAEEPERELARLATGDDSTAAPAQRLQATLALAEVKLARGDVAAAKAALATVNGVDTGDPRFGEAAVATLLAGGDVSGARTVAERWRNAQPASGAPHVWLARVALAEDNLELATTEIGKIGDAAGTFAAYLARAEIALAADDVAPATADIDRALALRPGDRAAQTLRARIDLEGGDAAAAEARLTPLYETARDPAVAALLGDALRRRGQRQRARSLLEEATLRLQASGGRPATLAAASLALAWLDYDEGRLADAQQAVSQVLAVRPQDVAARLLGARLRFDLGDAAAARADLDTLAVAAHTDPAVLLTAARVHLATRDPAGARQLLDEASKLPGVNANELVRESARLALVEGRMLDAVDLLTGGGREPTDGDSWMLLLEARLIAAAASNDLAAVDVTVAEIGRRFAGRPEESLALGRLQLVRRETEAALGSFGAALARYETAGAPPRVVSEARSWQGQAQEMAGRVDDALATYREASRLDPSSPLPAFLYGRLMLAKNDAGGAFEALSRAVKLDPSRADAHFHLGEAAVALKRGPAARQALETYLKLAPRGPFAERAQRLLGQL